MNEDKKFIFSLFVTFLFLILLGLYMSFSQGLPWRVDGYDFPKELYKQINNTSRFHEDNYGGSGFPYYGKFTEKNKVKIILLGDSHARHYASGFDVYFERKGISVFSISGTSCFHLPGFTRTTPGIDWNKRCPEQLDRLFKALKQYPDATVVLSHSWEEQLDRAAIIDEDKLVNKDVDIAHIIKSINILKEKIGKNQLVIIGNVPGSGVDRGLLSKITRPSYLLSDEKIKSINYRESIRDASRLAEKINYELFKESIRGKKYLFLNPFDALCSNNLCRNFDDQGRLIYSDSAHLSKKGSQYVIKYFYDQLMLVLSTRLVNH